jgi:hypothetical protein
MRVWLAMTCGVAALALAGVAQAATPVVATTDPASGVGSTTATLNGTILTGGLPATYTFEYGTSKSYGRFSSTGTIAAGTTTARTVSIKVTKLRPLTTYHFRLVVHLTGPAPYYYAQNFNGSDRTFKTKGTGRLLLKNNKLVIRHGRVGVTLICESNISCQGRFTLNTKAKLAKSKKRATILCATTTFNIKAHKTKTISPKVRSGCLSLIKRVKKRTVTGLLTSHPRTNQDALIKTVRIAFKS